MKIKKIKDIEFIDNDLYLMEVLKNYIVINNNYVGLKVLDKNFNLVREINVIWPGKESSHHLIYKQFNGNGILLHAVDPTKLLLIDTDKGTHNIFENGLNNIDFFSIYFWQDNTIILISSDNKFYEINTIAKLLSQISENSVKKRFEQFYNFFMTSKKYFVFKYIDQYSFIFIKNHQIGLFDFLKNEEKLLPLFFPNTQEIFSTWLPFNYEINGNTILQVSERELVVMSDENIKKINPAKKFSIGQVRFINSESFIVQFTKWMGLFHHYSILKIYQI